MCFLFLVFSLVTQLGKEFILIQVPIFVSICLLNKFQNIIVTNVDVQILIKNSFDVIQSHQSSLLSVKQCEQVKCFLLTTFAEKPFFCDHINDITERKGFFVIELVDDFVFNFLSVHFGKSKVTKNRSQMYTRN